MKEACQRTSAWLNEKLFSVLKEKKCRMQRQTDKDDCRTSSITTRYSKARSGPEKPPPRGRTMSEAACSDMPGKGMSKELICLLEGEKHYWQMLPEDQCFSCMVFFFHPISFQWKGQIQACICSQWGKTWSLLGAKSDRELHSDCSKSFEKKSLLCLALSRGSGGSLA